jgi:hypothetical protein
MESGAEGALVQGLSGAFLVGLAGFLYLHASYYRRFQHAAASSQTTTSLSFAYGIGFLLLTGVFLAALRHWSPHSTHALHQLWGELSPVHGLAAVFVVAPGMGLLAGVAGNLVRLLDESDHPCLADSAHPLYTTNLRARMRLSALAAFVKVSDDRLFATRWRAINLGKLIQVTLKSRKVYIGSPLTSADPSIENRWLKIVPIASGYRDSESLAYNATTDYRSLYDELADGAGTESTPVDDIDRQDLGVLISWTEIVSLTIYEPALEDYFGAAQA